MADLDSLQIRITASSDKATKAIDKLADALKSLGESVAPASSGLDSIAESLDRIVSNSAAIKDTAKAFKDLGKASATLASFSQLKGTGAQMSEVTNKAKSMAKAISSEWGIKSRDVIKNLTSELEKMYSNVGNDAVVGDAIHNIETMIRKYATFEKQANQTASAVREFMSTHKLYLSDSDKSDLGKDLIRNMGILHNVTSDMSKGTDAENYLRELNGLFNSENILGDTDNNTGLFDLSKINGTSDAVRELSKYLESTRPTVMTFSEALRDNTTTISDLDSALENLAYSVGTTVESSMEALRQALYGVSEASPQAAEQINQIDNATNNVADNVQPFEGIAAGLERISDVTIPESLKNLTFIKSLGGDMGQRAGASITQIADGLRSLNGAFPENLDVAKLSELAIGLRSLGSKNVVNAASALPTLAMGLQQLNSVGTVNVGGLAELGSALSMFGRKTAQTAVTTIPQLATAFRQLIDTLASAPAVSRNTIDLANAMANLSGNSRVLSPALSRANNSLNLFSKHAGNAKKKAFSLARVIGKLYANYFLFIRGTKWLFGSIDLASDLKEVQNVVDVTFGNMSDDMNEFAKTAVDTLGMSELTAKKIGSKFQAMGSAMGISKEMVKSTNDFVQAATKGYADVADGMGDISINLTKLAGDMASFYNQDYEEVAERLQAIFTGQTRPLRAYGLDLTQATLKEWALKNGLDADIKSMTQAEKTLLRYQYVMANTTAAHGDFERTIGTWANQMRIAKERLNQLRIVLGQIGIYTFKPLVVGFNDAMKRIIELATATLNSLGKIFGWEVEWSDAGVLQDDEDAASELADDMGDAADNAKKFKNFLLGIDELNVLPDKNDKDKNKGSGLGNLGGLGDMDGGLKIKETQKGFESLYDTLFKLGKRIAEVQKEWLKGIDWDKIYKNARKFGKGFAQFLNGYLSDIELFYHKGRFLANGINTIAHALDAFFKEFDGLQLGKDLGMELNGFTSNLDWAVIKSATYEMGHDIAEIVNGFFSGTNWKDVGRTIIEGINTAVLFASTILNEIDWMKIGYSIGDMLNSIVDNWDEREMARAIKGFIQGAFDLVNSFLTRTDFAALGQKLGSFLAELDLMEYADDIALLIWNLIKAAFVGLDRMFDEAPIETALITAFAGAKFLGFGKAVGGSMASAVSSNFAPALGTLLTTDLGTLAASSGLLGKAALLGTTVAASIVSAIAGYQIGKKIGKEIFKDCDQWYDMSAEEIFGGLIEDAEWIPKAFEEMAKDIPIKDKAKELKESATEGMKESMKTAGYARKALSDVADETERAGGATRVMSDKFRAMSSAVPMFSNSVVDASFALEKLGKDSGIEKVNEDLKSAKTTVNDFGTTIPTFTNSFNNATKTVQTDVTGMDDSFKKMFAETKANGTQFLVWFKSNFDSYFSAARWTSMLSAIPNAVNAMFAKTFANIKTQWTQFSKWTDENMKVAIEGKGGKETGGYKVKVGAYSDGGFPEDGLFMANHGEMVGKFANGKTAVANNEQIVEGIRQGVYDAVSAAMSGGNYGNITVEVTGDASDIFRAVVRENDRSIMRTGASPIRV